MSKTNCHTGMDFNFSLLFQICVSLVDWCNNVVIVSFSFWNRKTVCLTVLSKVDRESSLLSKMLLYYSYYIYWERKLLSSIGQMQ